MMPGLSWPGGVMIRTILTLVLLFCAGATLAETRGAKPLRPVPGDVMPGFYADSYALVIGIDAYTGGWPRLSKAVEDASAVAADLSARGFAVTLATNLDAATLDTTIKDFVYDHGEQADARLLIWFAGHGHQIGDEAYLVPADAPDPSQRGAFLRKALSMRDFGRYMREVRSRHVLAIFDSCFSGSVFELVRAAPPNGIDESTSLPVRELITSGEAGQTVSDNGLFRQLFLDALSGLEPEADTNRDGYLTGSELGRFMSYKLTSLTMNRQSPRFGKLRELGFDRGDFVFRIARVAAVEAAPATRGIDTVAAPVLTPPTPPLAGLPTDAPPLALNAPDPPAAAAPPPSGETLSLKDGSVGTFMEGRLTLAVLGTPFGGRSDLVGLSANGKVVGLGLGDRMIADGGDSACIFTVMQLAQSDRPLQVLMQCGPAPSEAEARAASLSLPLPDAPETREDLSLEDGETRLLMDGRVILSVLGTPYGGRSGLTGLVVNGENFGVPLGGVVALDGAADGCTLTVTGFGQKQATRMLQRCGAPAIEAVRKAASKAISLPQVPRNIARLTLAKGETSLVMDNRLALSNLGHPYGGRGDTVGLSANGLVFGMTLGSHFVANGPGDGCMITLTDLPADGGAELVLRCGGRLEKEDQGRPRKVVELLPEPGTVQSLRMQNGQSAELLDSRLILSMLGVPYGGRGDTVGLRVNGKAIGVTLGDYLSVDWTGGGCRITLTTLDAKQHVADFLFRCGGTATEDARRTARLAVDLPAPPRTRELFAMKNGTSRILGTEGTVMNVLGIPFGGRSDTAGVVLNGRRTGMTLGDGAEVPGGCWLTLTGLRPGDGLSDYLLLCD